MKAIEQGAPFQSFNERCVALQAQKEAVDQALEKEKADNPKMELEDIKSAILALAKLNFEDEYVRQGVTRMMVNRIYLYNDHMDILLNYKKSNNSIPLGENKRSKPAKICPPFLFIALQDVCKVFLFLCANSNLRHSIPLGALIQNLKSFSLWESSMITLSSGMPSASILSLSIGMMRLAGGRKA